MQIKKEKEIEFKGGLEICYESFSYINDVITFPNALKKYWEDSKQWNDLVKFVFQKIHVDKIMQVDWKGLSINQIVGSILGKKM